MQKMNPDIKKLWVEALRSGKYEQADSFLRYEDDGKLHYCCLGVLTDLYRKERKVSWDTASPRPPDMEMPTTKVCRWAGLDHTPAREDKHVASDEQGAASKLAEMNDMGRTFKQIAAYIERYL